MRDVSWRVVGMTMIAGLLLAETRAEEPITDLARLAPGWRGDVIAKVDQSYVGWDVEIGDADNDAKNEILVTGCPNSRLYLFEKAGRAWRTVLLANDLARRGDKPGMGLAVKVIDVDRDGKNELVLGTGQETGEPAYLYILRTDARRLTHSVHARPPLKGSAYTHNLAFHDLDRDGVLEIIAAYCGTGEIIRYDANKELTKIDRRKIYHNSGSGEDSFLVDVDNDGRVEYLTCDCYRDDQAKVLVFEFDDRGELVTPPRITIEGFDGVACFNGSIETGDVNNDGKTELIVGWKAKRDRQTGTILGYRIDDEGAEVVHTFAREDAALDLGYFEKMMCVADCDNDGKNDLIVTTRGEPRWGGGGLGHVFQYRLGADGEVRRTLIANFHAGKADACWPAVGDADNDGKNEIVIATGVGHREKPGQSHVVLIECP